MERNDIKLLNEMGSMLTLWLKIFWEESFKISKHKKFYQLICGSVCSDTELFHVLLSFPLHLFLETIEVEQTSENEVCFWKQPITIY